ncbi:MAG: hypothetical protein U0176_07940 [Bacteroidia bacterium]
MTNKTRAWIAIAFSGLWALLTAANYFEWVHFTGFLGNPRFLGTLCMMGHLGLYEKTGSIRQSVVGIFLWIPIIALGASMLFRIMHWPYGGEIFMAGIGSIVLLYCVHFVLKPVRRIQDILRLCVVLVAATYFLLMSIFLIDTWFYLWAVIGIMTLTTLEYVLNSGNHPQVAPEGMMLDERPIGGSGNGSTSGESPRDELSDQNLELFE